MLLTVADRPSSMLVSSKLTGLDPTLAGTAPPGLQFL
jgi:hypothetical protein